MIVLQLSGGLGNQMFQIAMAWRLAAEGKRVAIDDATAYREMGEKARPLQLADAFGITYERASREDISRLRDESPKLQDKVRRRLFGRKLREVHDRDFVYDASLLSLDEVYLAGTFQCPAYFAPIREKVRKNFAFTKAARKAPPAVQAMAEQIRKTGNSCSVHLRFGDYLEKADVYGGICTKAYYEAALRRVLAKRGKATFFVFSNDEEKAASWIREEEKQFPSAGASFVPVTGNDEAHGYLDLYLMTLTRDHVIANSSFSWWGAYLGEKPDGLVIAPALWIHEPDGSELQRRDIYTKGMILLTPRGEEADELIGREPGEYPLVSVITACYNIAPYAARAIHSLTGQTLRNLEILAVDDGSTDETGKILEALAKEDPRIKVIHKENGGLSDCRNAGLAAARGRYIGYLDGDDWADPRMFETLVRGCLLTGAGMAALRYLPVEEGDRAVRDPDLPVSSILRESTLLEPGAAAGLWIDSSLRGPEEEPYLANSVWSKLFRRDVCEGISFVKGKNSEDILYTAKTLLRTDALLYVPRPLYHYTVSRAGSIMSGKTGERRVRDEIPFWQEQIRLFAQAGRQDLADRARFSLERRLLYYITDMQGSEAAAPYRKELEELLLKDPEADRLCRDPKAGAKGDRLRVCLYRKNPRLYFWIDRMRTRRNGGS